MFDEKANILKADNRMEKDLYYDRLEKKKRQSAMRFLDMQQVVGAKLLSSQQSVDNAQNYPSTWTTNPDGGSNGQV